MVTVLEHEFFLSEILGRRVFVKKKRIGRLSDLAIVETGKLPEVTHVVVSRPYGDPTLTVPWDKVLIISNQEVVLDLDEDALTQFHPSAGENLILLRDHILDKKILDMDDHEVEIVYDVKLAFQNGKLYASEVDFSHYRALRRLGLNKLANLLADRNKENRVSWLYVQPLPQQLGSFAGNIKLTVPKAGLGEIHPVDLADILEELDGGQRVALFNSLEAEHASATLEEVEPRVQRELIRAIKKERAAHLINEMTPAQAADILAILPRDEAAAILRLIDQDMSSKVGHIIGEHDEQILLYGSPEVIRLSAATAATEVLDRYRELAAGKDVVMYVYVTDSTGALKGVVDIREIVAAAPGQTLGDIMTEHVISLPQDATLRDAAMLFERYNFRALPITDANDLLLGAVSMRDVRSLRPRLA
ncbi:MAG TPA: CBS domain-containing protein [Candidatus Binataceae bacterium]|nr:CBS domain-containing protein [Candidatus Binataceae bacterium]